MSAQISLKSAAVRATKVGPNNFSYKQFELNFPIARERNHAFNLHQKSTTFLPSRLSMPLFPFAEEIKQYLISGDQRTLDPIHSVYDNSIEALRVTLSDFKEANSIKEIEQVFDMTNLTLFALHKISTKARIYSRVAHQFASKAMLYDLQLAAFSPQKYDNINYLMEEYPGLLYIIQRYRNQVSISEQKRIQMNEWKDKLKSVDAGTEPMTFISEFGHSIIQFASINDRITIYFNGHFGFYYSSSMNKICIFDHEHFNFMITSAEVVHNMKLIRNSKEYVRYKKVLNTLIELAESDIEHRLKVKLMKAFEPICLFKSDYLGAEIVAWDPIMDTLKELQSVDSEINKMHYTLANYHNCFLDAKGYQISRLWGIRLLASIEGMTGIELQEASALHKGLFYSEINEDKGVLKYLMRTHTKRHIEPEAIDEKVSLFRKMFTINFIKRHSECPVIIEPQVKSNFIITCFQSNQINKLDSLPIGWWNDIKFGHTIDNAVCLDPLEFAKDKGSTKNDIKHTYGDSIPELMHILETEKYEVTPLPLKDFIPKRESHVEFIQSDITPSYYEYPTRLIMKEREQKEEGRLFASTTTKNKHGLSYYMELVKKVLSYIDGEFMTVSDKDRKKILHRAAQSLFEQDTYSILLDIEGHNQSMQYHNIGPLAKAVGEIFGEDDWDLLSNLFNNLHIYYYYHYHDKVMVSEGQYGGVEGWENPLWTLDTTLVTHLLAINEKIELREIMVYSDDVNLIVNFYNLNSESLNRNYHIITNHYFKYGLIVKPSQTALSKHRCTILRQHYHDGIKADSSLKKLLSSSIFCEDVFINEIMETTGVTSSISSGLEYTNNVMTCLYFKWFKSAFILLRSTAAYFETPREGSLINLDLLPEGFRRFFFSGHYEMIRQLSLPTDEMSQLLTNMIDIPQLDNATLLDKKTFLSLIRESLGFGLNEMIKLDFIDMFLYMFPRSNYMFELLFYRMIMPEKLGGCGIDLFITQALSGYSDNYAKKMYYIHQSIKISFVNKWEFFKLMRHAMGDNFYDEDSNLTNNGNMNETNLIRDRFPIHNQIVTVTSLINREIKSFVKKRCINKKIKENLLLSDHEDDFLISIMRLLRHKFDYRLASYYHENSKFRLLKMFLAKVETSRTFIKRSNNTHKVRAKLFKSVLMNQVRLFSTSTNPLDIINIDSDMIALLIEKRIRNYPKVDFINIEMPLYDQILVETTIPKSFVTAYFQSGQSFDNNVLKYNTPEFSSDTLMKFDRDAEFLIFDRVEKKLVYNLVLVTKWIISNSLKANHAMDQELLESNQVIQVCNLGLQTLTDRRYIDLKDYVRLPTGGEVFHRLNYMTFKTSSCLRILPNETIHYTVLVDQGEINTRNLEDSNIDFDYMKLRVHLAVTIRKYLNVKSKYTTRFLFRDSPVIKNVQFDFLHEPRIEDIESFQTRSLIDISNSDLNKMKFLDITYLEVENDVQSSVALISLMNADSDREDILSEKQLVARYYSKLKTEFMTLPMEIQDEDIWVNFIEAYKSRIPEWTGLNDLEIISRIKLIMSESLRDTLRSTRQYNITVEDRLVIEYLESELLENDELVTKQLGHYVKQYAKMLRIAILKQNERKLMNLKKLGNAITVHADKLAYTILMHLMINYTLHYHVQDDILVLDKLETIERTQEALEYDMDVFLKDDLLLVSFFLIQAPRLRDNFKKIQNKLCTKLQICLDSFDTVTAYIDNRDIKVKTRVKYDLFSDLDDLEKQIKYTSTVLDKATLIDHDRWRKTTTWMKESTYLYAQPGTFASPTGSDSYLAQFGLFKLLLSEKIINVKTPLIDLTAGRGDGNIAGRKLGLDIVSYNNDVIFLNKLCSDQVITKIEYDATKPDTIQFINAYKHVHIDISFFIRKENDMTDTILTLMEKSKSFSLRVNSVMLNMDVIYTLAQKYRYQLSLSYAVSGNLKPYQIYLIGYITQDPIFDNSTPITASTCFKQVVSNYAELIKFSNMCNIDTNVHRNSITAIINKDISINDLMTDIKDNMSYTLDNALVNKFLKNREFNHYLECAPELVPENILQMAQFAVINTKSNINYRQMEIFSPHRQNKKYSKHKAQHAERLISRKTNLIKLEYSKLNEECLNYFAYNHPFYIFRHIANLYLNLRENILLNDMNDYNEIINYLEEYKIEHQGVQDKLTESAYLGLVLLAYNARFHNYEHGIKMIWGWYSSPTSDKKMIIHVLKYYRLASSFFYQFSTEPITMKEALSLKEYVDTNLIRRFYSQMSKKRDTMPIELIQFHEEDDYKSFDRKAFFDKIVDSFIKADAAPNVIPTLDIETLVNKTKDDNKPAEIVNPEAMQSGITDMFNKLIGAIASRSVDAVEFNDEGKTELEIAKEAFEDFGDYGDDYYDNDDYYYDNLGYEGNDNIDPEDQAALEELSESEDKEDTGQASSSIKSIRFEGDWADDVDDDLF